MEIKESSNGQGLFSKACYLKGDVIFRLSGKIEYYPTRKSIHIGNGLHITDHYGSFMNHSFNPSTEISGYNIIATIDIQSGDELTFDYNASEDNMAEPFYSNGKLVSGKNSDKYR